MYIQKDIRIFMVYNFFLVSLLFSDYTKLKTCACSVSFFFFCCIMFIIFRHLQFWIVCIFLCDTHTHQLNVRLIFFFDRNLNKLSIYAYARVCLFLFAFIWSRMRCESKSMRIMQNIIFAGFTLFSWHELCAPLFQFVLGVVKYIFYWKIEFIHARAHEMRM